MFSGIKYILGYTDETANAPASSNNDAGVSDLKEQQKTIDLSLTDSNTISTTVLEQTLNAATTKFTEQLLPQQASIEQLQSSSHQLLPSIIEQHEEEEKKKSSLELTESQVLLNDENEEDDDINVDSWELLDLVEKVEDVAQQGSLITTSVQKEGAICPIVAYTPAGPSGRSTSGGILKSSSNTGNNNENNDNLQSRQKQKVSFETPDLVKCKQGIEQTKPKEESATATGITATISRAVEQPESVAPVTGSTKRGKNNNKKAKNSKAQGAGAKNKEENEKNSKSDRLEQARVEVGNVVANKAADKKPIKEKETCKEQQDVMGVGGGKPLVNPSPEVGTSKGGEQKKLVSSELSMSITAKKVPVLNYAKALSAKPKAQAAESDVKRGGGKDVKVGPRLVGVAVHSQLETPKGATATSESSTDQNGPVKRSRPLSTSSWSSSDEVEDVGKSNVVDCQKPSDSVVKSSPSIMNESARHQDVMNESLISSGFSDCDYGFSGLNDYIMRPKKAYTKRGRSGSSTKARRSEGGASKSKNQSATTKSSEVDESDSVAVLAKTPMEVTGHSKVTKNTKPKKKRMVMSTSKLVSPSDFLKQKRSDSTKNKHSEQKQSSRNGSNESSDIAEMDESWFVTPPPCFTGASSIVAQSGTDVEQPRAKEAARENALIEHPSIYIASTSKDFSKAKVGKPSMTVNKKSAEAPPSSPSPVKTVGKKAALIIEDSAWASEDDDLSDIMSIGKPADLIDDDDDDQIQPTSSFDEVRSHSEEPHKENLEETRDETSLETKASESKRATKSNIATVARAERQRGADCVKPLTQVRPIEPERRPGWQLKRQRSKRRSSLNVATNAKHVPGEPKLLRVKDKSNESSVASSNRSTPTSLIDRIGTSIVTNLTNLTSGLVSSGAMNYCSSGHHANLMESNSERTSHGPLADKTSSNVNFGQDTRKQMSRGFLKRQNKCVMQGNSLRRPDRRLKMFTTMNGCSVNRKVHTSIH